MKYITHTAFNLLKCLYTILRGLYENKKNHNQENCNQKFDRT